MTARAWMLMALLSSFATAPAAASEAPSVQARLADAVRRTGTLLRATPAMTRNVAVAGAHWVRANPKQAMILGAGVGVMVASAVVVGPHVTVAVAGALPHTALGSMIATGTGGA